jgi:protein-S-isoprenylcysteine O-methyltransferase Ste14
MEWEIIFRLANLGILGGFTLIRIPYVYESIQEAATPQDRKTSIIYGIISALMVTVGFYYLYHPQILSWFSVSLPFWMRIMGVVIGVIGNGLLFWTHVALAQVPHFLAQVTDSQ